ncbi:MAG: ABC transporter substrate-binding protein [Deltaproteobacteria bacterium]|nr:ABC transporter substrate-binding protein [Deltaproteobacteria bacterium]
MRAGAFTLIAAAALVPACLRTGPGSCGGDLPSDPGCRCPDGGLDAGPEPDAGPARRGGRVVIRVEDEPTTLLSLAAPGGIVRRIVDHDVQQSLVRYDFATGTPAPELASRWEMSADGRMYVFHLDPAAQWHDGRPVTATDVAFTFGWIADPAGGCAKGADFTDVASVEARDTATVAIALDRPRPDFLAALDAVPILPSHVFGKNSIPSHPAARAPVGSGPLRFVRWDKGRAIVLERNPLWKGPAPFVDSVEYRVVRDRRVAIDLLRRGDVDIVPDLDGAPLPASADWRTRTYPLPGVEAWICATSRPFCSDPGVRTALARLIDRDAVRCSVMGCNAGAARAFPPPRFNPRGARGLLEAAGWVDRDGDNVRDKGGARLALTLILPDGRRSYESEAELVREDMAASGVEVNVLLVDESTYAERLRRRAFDVTIATVDGSSGTAAAFDPGREGLAVVAATFAPRAFALVRHRVHGLVVRDGRVEATRLWVSPSPRGGNP